jgi:hypothetical protein
VVGYQKAKEIAVVAHKSGDFVMVRLLKWICVCRVEGCRKGGR